MAEKAKKIYYPLMLDITDKNILIIGGGPAAAEKLRSLSQTGKTVKVIAREFSDAFRNQDWLQLEQRAYQSGDLQGFDLVYVGINDPQEEERILHDAKNLNLLINFVDKVENSDFISPSVLLRENFALFISTYGKGPGMTKKIRKTIEEKIDLDALNREAGEYFKKREKGEV